MPPPCCCARPRRSAATWLDGVAWLVAGRRAGGAGPADRQVLHRQLPAAAQRRHARDRRPAGRRAGRRHASASWLRYLQLVRLAGLAMRSVQRIRETRVRPRAAAADELLRPRHHRPAGQPRHQRHRGREDAVRAGAVRHARQHDHAGRRDGRDAVAGLAADADRRDAGARGGADRHRCTSAFRRRP